MISRVSKNVTLLKFGLKQRDMSAGRWIAEFLIAVFAIIALLIGALYLGFSTSGDSDSKWALSQSGFFFGLLAISFFEAHRRLPEPIMKWFAPTAAIGLGGFTAFKGLGAFASGFSGEPLGFSLGVIFAVIGGVLLYLGVASHSKTFGVNAFRPYYLLPVTLGIVGGVVAFFMLRRSSKKTADALSWLGLHLSLIGAVLTTLI